MALLPASLHQAGGSWGRRAWHDARGWANCALNLAFPWPDSAEAEPVRIDAPFCRQCGYPYPALEGHSGDFTCNNCVNRTWHFDWARSGYRTEGQVLEAVIGYKYSDQYYRESQLVDWLTETYDRHVKKGEWGCPRARPTISSPASRARFQPGPGNRLRAVFPAQNPRPKLPLSLSRNDIADQIESPSALGEYGGCLPNETGI